MVNRRKYPVLAVCALLLYMKSFSQIEMAGSPTDSLAIVKEMAGVSQFARQLPVHLRLFVQNATNVLTSPEDTASLEAEFFLQKEGAYVRFGEVEQLVDDSLALLVSRNAERIFVYTSPQTVFTRMKSLAGTPLAKSSLREMTARFTTAVRDLDDGLRCIELTSRQLLFQTSLPRETIQFIYNTKKGMPVKLSTLKRTLVPLDAAVDENGEKQKESGGDVVAINGEPYRVKAQRTEYRYLQIDHEQKDLPVKIKDRISRTVEAGYIAAKGYESYGVIIN